jgi:threonine dehydratase
MDSAAAERRIRAFVRETPLEPSAALGTATGARVFLKLENRQETGAFKLRGAANKLLSIPKEAAARGIVAASTGNHALAVSTIAGKLGIPVEIFVSEQIHPYKRRKIEALGARINAVAGDALAAELEARRESERSGRPYVSPYNDPVVIEGQGTVAVEILRQMTALGEPKLDAVFVAVGGGGLIGGMGTYLKRISPTTEVVACWPENSRALYECLNAGAIIDVPEKPTYSTSTAGGVEPGAITLGICAAAIDRKLLVTETEILEAARRLEREDGELVEGAAAVAVAAFVKSAGDYAGRSVALLICGGNAEPEFAELVREA